MPLDAEFEEVEPLIDMDTVVFSGDNLSPIGRSRLPPARASLRRARGSGDQDHEVVGLCRVPGYAAYSSGSRVRQGCSRLLVGIIRVAIG